MKYNQNKDTSSNQSHHIDWEYINDNLPEIVEKIILIILIIILFSTAITKM